MMTKPTLSFVLILSGVFVACGSNDQQTPSPDPSVTTSGSGGNGTGGNNVGGDTSSSSSSSSGAGGADGQQSAGFVSGTRLRARFLEGSDGSKHFMGFFDSDKGVDCEYSAYSDNGAADEKRCFPSFTVPRFMDITNSATRYSDSNCTQKAAPVVTPCPISNDVPAYIAEKLSCYVFGTHQVTGTGSSYQLSGTNCVPSSTQVYVTTPVPFTEWVEGTEVVE